MNTLDLLEIASSIVPDRIALLESSGDQRQATYSELRMRVGRLASAMEGLGVKRGDRVALLDVNSPAHVETYFACAAIDAIFVPVNFRARPRELAGMLASVEPALVVASPRYVDVVDEAVRQVRPGAIRMSTGPTGAQGWVDYETKLAARDPMDRPPDGGDESPTMVMFTSGTSARPRGVTLTHSSFCSYVLGNVTPAEPTSEERVAITVPLYHIAGVQVLMAGVYGGRVHVLQPQFEPAAWMQLVEHHRISRAMLVPTMMRAVVEHPDFDRYDLSSLRFITYGAAAMPVDVLEKAIERFPNASFINAFGQTESAATITMLGPEDHHLRGDPVEVEKKRRRLRSIGKPLPDVEVRIVGESGNDVAPGETGEIVARGARMMKGYWGSPDATRTVLQGGWLHTGDLGYQDGDGYIFLAGRAREFIKRGGEIISPEEVEEVLSSHPAVLEAAVIGVPDRAWGEVVHAVVALRPGAAVAAAELIEHCRRSIASFKKPERVHFVDQLPRTQLGKIMRSELRDRFAPPAAASGPCLPESGTKGRASE